MLLQTVNEYCEFLVLLSAQLLEIKRGCDLGDDLTAQMIVAHSFQVKEKKVGWLILWHSLNTFLRRSCRTEFVLHIWEKHCKVS